MTPVADPVAPRRRASQRMTLSEQLIQLARRYADQGDVRRAQLATWAADVHVLEELLWENGLNDVPDPVAQLAVVGESVAAALEELAVGLEGQDPASTVAAARRAMISTFDPSVHEMFGARLPGLGHLEVRAPGDAAGSAPGVDRLGGRTPWELVSELRQAAVDCVHVGEALRAGGEAVAADRMAYQADTATFEAYLIAAAVRAGDERLVSVDLRWDLARDLRPGDGSGSQGGDAFATLRRQLTALVGSAEMESLWQAFESTGEV